MSTTEQDTRDEVRARHADAAMAVVEREQVVCCGVADEEGFGARLYAAGDAAGLPDAAVLASLGCGNPTAVAELGEGETVLDLGSGGGIDVLLSARRVGPGGRAYGLDMTSACCAPVVQATCCEPSQKPSCCGAAAAGPGACGCQ